MELHQDSFSHQDKPNPVIIAAEHSYCKQCRNENLVKFHIYQCYQMRRSLHHFAGGGSVSISCFRNCTSEWPSRRLCLGVGGCHEY